MRFDSLDFSSDNDADQPKMPILSRTLCSTDNLNVELQLKIPILSRTLCWTDDLNVEMLAQVALEQLFSSISILEGFSVANTVLCR